MEKTLQNELQRIGVGESELSLSDRGSDGIHNGLSKCLEDKYFDYKGRMIEHLGHQRITHGNIH